MLESYAGGWTRIASVRYVHEPPAGRYGEHGHHDPSGGWSTFIREPSADSGGNKAYLSPAGLNATLVVNSSGCAILTYNTSRIKYEFAESGRLEKIVDPNGNTTTFHYNAEGKTSSVIDTHGHTVTFSYEGGKEEDYISKISDELGRHWKFSENSENQISGESDPDGHELKYEYNTQDNPKQITDPIGHLIEISYDSEERVSKIRCVVNGTATTPGSKDVITTYAYSIPVSGSVSCPAGSYGDTKVVSPDGSPNGDGNKTKYEYNTKHDLIKITPPSPLGVTEITYDAIDRIKTVKDGRGITATYTYNGEDQVTKVEYSDGSSVSFEYDADGNTVKRTDAAGFGEPYTGVTSYEYDKLNRPTLETTPTAKSTTYEYDYDGNLTSLKDTGGTVGYTYGPDDVLATLTEPGNSSHPFKFGYETGDDNRESILYPNGILQCYKTDPAGRLTSLRAFKPTSEQTCASSVSPSSTLEDYSLSYAFEVEEEGKKVSVDTPDLQTLTNLKAENATAYGYDNLDNLREAVTKPTTGGAATLTSEYEYDNAGNMTINHTFSPSTTYSKNYDKYNAADEICAIGTTAPSACASPSEPGIAGEPTYDADGDMTSDGSASPTKFAYTERDQLSSVTPHGGSATAIVSHGTGQEDLAAIGTEEVIQNVLGLASTGSGESASYYTRGSEGQLLAKRKPGEKPSETQYYLQDPTGSPALLTSSTGTQTAPTSGTYQYDPYGNPIGTGPSTIGYRSGQILPDGLIHYGARYYDSANANWTQLDPLGEGLIYAGDNPTNASDPSGTCITLGPLGFGCEGNAIGVQVGFHGYVGISETQYREAEAAIKTAIKRCGFGVSFSGGVYAVGTKLAGSALKLREGLSSGGLGCVAGEVQPALEEKF